MDVMMEECLEIHSDWCFEEFLHELSCYGDVRATEAIDVQVYIM